MPGTSPASAADAFDAPAPAAPAKPRAPSGRPPAYPGLARELLRDAAARARGETREALFRSAPYRLALGGPLPDRLAVIPDALVTATLEGAQDILRGRFSLPSGTLDVRAGSPFDMAAEPAVRAELHGFEWLAHLEKAGGKTAAFVAKALTEDWIDRFQRFRPLPWRGDVLGTRLCAWAAHFRFLIQDGDLLFRSRLLKAMAEQSRHLPRAIPLMPHGTARLEAAAAMVTLDAALGSEAKRRARGFENLRQAIAGALLDDGGVATRNPHEQMRALAALTRAGRALHDAHQPLPPSLPPALDGLRATLALLRHGDGRLGCFNGGSEGSAALIAELLDGAPLDMASAFAPDWRYGRMAAGRSVVLADGGGPPAGAFATGAHAAPLAFEFSHGDQRIIVNGGVARRRGAEWIDAARRTAAHATLEIGDSDAGTILGGAAGRRLGPRLFGGNAEAALDAAAGGVWLEGRHDLYAARFGVTHQRRLFLDPSGEDLRGEDQIVRTLGRGRGRLELVVRFPIHPDCRATLAQGGESVIVAPPNGEAWRFKAAPLGPEDTLTLEQAAYMGGESVRRCQAIVIRATPADLIWTLRWAIKRDGAALRTRRRLV